MLIMFKVTVAVAGTPGPLLGDGVNSTVTMLYPATLTEDLNSMGSRQSVINRLAAAGRADYTVKRLTVFTLRANTNDAFFGARGSAAANMLGMAANTGTPTLGNGQSYDISLGDFDIDVTTGGEGFIVVAEA